MKKNLLRLGRAITFLAAIGLLAFGAASIVTVADVIGRRIGLPIPGVIDLVQLFIMAGVWLIMPYAFYSGAHVGVDFIVDRMPGRVQTVVRILGSLIAIVLLVLMAWYGYVTSQQRIMFGDTSQELGIPIVWFWAPLLAGMIGSIVAAVLVMLGNTTPEVTQ